MLLFVVSLGTKPKSGYTIPTKFYRPCETVKKIIGSAVHLDCQPINVNYLMLVCLKIMLGLPNEIEPFAVCNDGQLHLLGNGDLR